MSDNICSEEVHTSEEQVESEIARKYKLVNNGPHTQLHPSVCCYHFTKPRLQVGPTCGFTATILSLSAIFRQLKFPNFITSTTDTSSPYCRAIREGYTVKGELFNCTYLLDVVQWTFDSLSQVENQVKKEIHAEVDTIEKVDVKHIINQGGVLIVVYDKDGNGEPCLKDGEKSHWGVVLGYIETVGKIDYVVLLQGKSKYYSVISLEFLIQSSNQIRRVGPKVSKEEYVIPDGGNLEMLAGKCIIVKSKSGGRRPNIFPISI
ncbi:hypothetical protein BKA69DRAFT_840568 [Paraphysoderma sedebokerense]|nr:hypothetical protein BKA69DRAFT_840568 [Paraphysoderma sedebokerense]